MVSYLFVRFFIWIFRIMPFGVLEQLSRLLAWALQHLIGYRRAVMEDNLKSCFPDQDPARRKETIRLAYRNLASVLLESIKGLSLTGDEIRKRNRMLDAELVDRYLDQGKSVICVCGHYANWEWSVLGIGYRFPGKSIGIYKKINNPRVEAYIKSLRARSTMKLLTTHETRFMTEDLPKGRLILLMSDQNPSNSRDAIWVNFFGRDTACLHGLEKYARQYDLPVIYMDMERQKPAWYQLRFSLLCEHPSSLQKGELTQMFMSRLEETIRRYPPDWLWSHKRWKHKRKN